jgi:indole-3-acetate monooxygenase
MMHNLHRRFSLMASDDHRETSAAPFDFPAATGGAAVDESLLAGARALEPTIRQYADTTERERRLAHPVLLAMREAGLFRMFTPRTLGGLETDPVTVARIAEEVASFDSAAAWALQAGNTGAWWAGHLSEKGIAVLFADGPDLLLAASFSPPHRAESVPGGYRFTGRGPLASTIHDSPWVMMTGIVFDGDEPRTTSFGPMIVALMLRTSEVQIIDTWVSLGMRGTDSNDVSVDGVFVPEARSFVVAPVYEPGPHFTGPLYRVWVRGFLSEPILTGDDWRSSKRPCSWKALGTANRCAATCGRPSTAGPTKSSIRRSTYNRCQNVAAVGRRLGLGARSGAHRRTGCARRARLFTGSRRNHPGVAQSWMALHAA